MTSICRWLLRKTFVITKAVHTVNTSNWITICINSLKCGPVDVKENKNLNLQRWLKRFEKCYTNLIVDPDAMYPRSWCVWINNWYLFINSSSDASANRYILVWLIFGKFSTHQYSIPYNTNIGYYPLSINGSITPWKSAYLFIMYFMLFFFV